MEEEGGLALMRDGSGVGRKEIGGAEVREWEGLGRRMVVGSVTMWGDGDGVVRGAGSGEGVGGWEESIGLKEMQGSVAGGEDALALAASCCSLNSFTDSRWWRVISSKSACALSIVAFVFVFSSSSSCFSWSRLV